MTKEEILHLGRLSRIKMTDEEVVAFKAEIDPILEYVSAVNDLVDSGDLRKVPGAVHNVFRDDIVSNEPGFYTKDIVAAFPASRDGLLEVKKILDPDSTS